MIMSKGTVLGDARQMRKLLYLPKVFLCYNNSYMGKNRKCAVEANYGEPSQTIVTINKAIFLYDLHRIYVKTKHIQTDLFHQKQNEYVHPILHPKITPRVNRYGDP